MIMGMLYAPGRAVQTRQYPVDEAGYEGIMADPACYQHFEGEDSARDRCAEYGAKACSDTRHQENADIFFRQFTDLPEKTGHAAPDLNRSAFPSGRPAEQVGDDGGQQYQGGHPRGHPAARFM